MPVRDQFGFSAQHAHCACRGGVGTFGGEAAEDHYPPSLELEPIHLKIALNLDLKNERALGRVTHTVHGNREGARVLTLNAMAFEDLKVLGGGHKSAYDGKQIEIVWDKPFA